MGFPFKKKYLRLTSLYTCYTLLYIVIHLLECSGEKGRMYSEMNISPLKGDKVHQCNETIDGKNTNRDFNR